MGRGGKLPPIVPRHAFCNAMFTDWKRRGYSGSLRSWSLFAPQYTMAAVIANEFAEAADNLHLSALLEVGLVLFGITLIVNVGSRLLIWRMTRTPRQRPVSAVVPAAESAA